ncbi:MAG: hypothetical protein HQL57_02330 [Magnetococcales bacterium]|nr:hypothetical protein [Magnetococcales bacterium]MBF0156003.1 hypothetical protein [Magnetococcales bacterium]
MDGAVTMETTLGRLEELARLLERPELLDGESVGAMAQEWESAVLGLVQDHEARVASGRKAPLGVKRRLTGLLERLPAITAALATHRSEIARQLLAENRRLQAMRFEYGGMQRRESFLLRKQG